MDLINIPKMWESVCHDKWKNPTANFLPYENDMTKTLLVTILSFIRIKIWIIRKYLIAYRQNFKIPTMYKHLNMIITPTLASNHLRISPLPMQVLTFYFSKTFCFALNKLINHFLQKKPRQIFKSWQSFEECSYARLNAAPKTLNQHYNIT